MRQSYVTHKDVVDFLARLDTAFARPGRIYLVGETSQVFEKWRNFTTQIEFASDIAPGERESFERIVADLERELKIPVIDESPGDLIPLPDDHESRARRVTGVEFLEHLALYHFDPYSVAFRFIARGDEPDYHILLTLLEHGWVTVGEMDAKLSALLPRFTLETIQQDPAEFRRKYKGMLQMWRAVPPRTTHRPTRACRSRRRRPR